MFATHKGAEVIARKKVSVGIFERIFDPIIRPAGMPMEQRDGMISHSRHTTAKSIGVRGVVGQRDRELYGSGGAENGPRSPRSRRSEICLISCPQSCEILSARVLRLFTLDDTDVFNVDQLIM